MLFMCKDISLLSLPAVYFDSSYGAQILLSHFRKSYEQRNKKKKIKLFIIAKKKN